MNSANRINLEVSGPEGAGVVLCVHGAGGGAWQWGAFRAIADRHVRVAAIDLPGHGGSPSRGDVHSMDTYVDAVLEAVEAVGGAAVLCGHSMGGAVAMNTYLRLADSEGFEAAGRVVRGLVLANTGARLRVMPAIYDAIESGFEAAAEMMQGFALGATAPREVVDEYKAGLLAAGAAVTANDFRVCDSHDVMGRAGDIRCPALVIGCESDKLTPVKYSEWLATNLPDAKMKIFPEFGHCSMLEAPDGFAAAVFEFLRG